MALFLLKFTISVMILISIFLNMGMFRVLHLAAFIFPSLFGLPVSSHVVDFNTRNKILTAKLLKQGNRYHKLRKAFSKCYRRHYGLVSKFNVGLKSLLKQGLSELEFYGDLLYKFRKIVRRKDFRKIITQYKRFGYNINVQELSRAYNLKQLINEATHFTESSSSLIDVILVDKTTHILASEVCDPFIPNSVRFHCPVVVFLKILKPRLKCYKRKVWSYDQGHYFNYRQLLD